MSVTSVQELRRRGHQVVVFEIEQVGEEDAETPPEPGPLDVPGDHRQVCFHLHVGTVEHPDQRGVPL